MTYKEELLAVVEIISWLEDKGYRTSGGYDDCSMKIHASGKDEIWVFYADDENINVYMEYDGKYHGLDKDNEIYKFIYDKYPLAEKKGHNASKKDELANEELERLGIIRYCLENREYKTSQFKKDDKAYVRAEKDGVVYLISGINGGIEVTATKDDKEIELDITDKVAEVVDYVLSHS